MVILCSITLKKLKISNSSIFSDSQTGLNLVLSNVDLAISISFSLSSRTEKINFATNGLNLHLGILVKRDNNGQPLFSITNCSFEIGNYSISGNRWVRLVTVSLLVSKFVSC